MRPDEHKRRKNEKYKKKHGMSGSQSTDGCSKKTDKERDRTRPLKSGHNDKQDHEDIKHKPKDDPSVQDEPVTRRLPDNWDRYEEDEDEEDERFMPEMRGEDFNKLIAESGGSSSRFRFKDEDDWAEVCESDKTDNQEVSLNFDNLALALDCIPLCERLGLSTDLFTNNQVEEMIKTANVCKAKYSETIQTQIFARESITATVEEGGCDVQEEDTVIKNKTSSVEDSKAISKSDTKAQNLGEKTKNLEEKTNSSHHVYVNSRGKDGSADVKSEQSVKEIVIGEVKQADISSLEDDLDSLLSFDLPSENNEVNDKIPAAPKSSQPVGPKPVSKSSQPVAPKQDSVTKTSSNSAEDWLDDLLAA